MARIGKISPIPKEYNRNSGVQSMEKSLSLKGLNRVPGTGVLKYPYREMDGKYRTGLDPDASYIKRILDKTAREIEIERVVKLKEKLEMALSLDLSPRSEYWNPTKAKSLTDTTHIIPVKLTDSVNYFDLDNAIKELEFAWLRVHPTIAPSMQAWTSGECPPDVQFYVVDEELENEILFKKKKVVNDAIQKFNSMGISKQRRIARLLGLPITDDTKEEVVYNQVDTILKQEEMKTGSFMGLNPIEVFGRFADMKENLLHVKDIIEQALAHSIYRERNDGTIYEGQFEVSKSKEELSKFLVDDEHQLELIELENKLKMKKIVAV